MASCAAARRRTFDPTFARPQRRFGTSLPAEMTDASRAARPQSASITQMTEYVLPQHTNALGGVFGGQIMAWIDLCAAICAQRHSGRMAVTAFVDDLKFEQPVRVGEVVRLEARITATFRTSMEIEVVVEGEDATTGRRWPCVTARLTFVAIDESRHPTPIPSPAPRHRGGKGIAGRGGGAAGLTAGDARLTPKRSCPAPPSLFHGRASWYGGAPP